jgi:hypothetical protein
MGGGCEPSDDVWACREAMDTSNVSTPAPHDTSDDPTP